MAYKMRKLQPGFFASVNGFPVRTHRGLATTFYTDGFPKAILWHYTAGCGDADIFDVLKARGISVSFCVGRDGTIVQFLPLDTAGWHAFSMSHFAVGIEHITKGPGTDCLLTDRQLEASAALSAAIIERTKTKHAFTIPTDKRPAPVTMTNVQPGFFDHRDGDPSWNENGHTDHLFRWTWDKYLGAIEDILAPAPTYEVTVFRKGQDALVRTFGKIGEAWAFARERVRKGLRVQVREQGPGAGPEA